MYQIAVARPAVKFLEKISDKKLYFRLSKAINELAINPYSKGTTKLKGSENEFRVRVGDYRIIYTVQDNILLVTVIYIDHRKQVYK